MELDWDEKKRIANLNKHKLDFMDVVHVMEGETVIFQDERRNYGEQRWIVYGKLNSYVVSFVYTIRDNKMRIISMRKASRSERQEYEQKINATTTAH